MDRPLYGCLRLFDTIAYIIPTEPLIFTSGS